MVRKMCRVTMDSSISAAMYVHLPDDIIMTFCKMPNEFYYHDTFDSDSNNINTDVNAYHFVTTVDDDKFNYTRREIAEAYNAISFDKILVISVPSVVSWTYTLLATAPSRQSIPSASSTYDKDYLKGKTTRTTPQYVAAYVSVPIPQSIKESHLNVSLCVALFVHGTPFLHTILCDLIFHTIGKMTIRSKEMMVGGLCCTVNMYETGGF